jgi:formamidopyrimidine-DNA glycosylase
LLELDGDRFLVLHLGMSGRLDLVAAGAALRTHTHVILQLESGSELRFSDPRRFGMLFVCERGELASHPRLRRLGVEPFDDDFTVEYLLARARRGKRPVKNFLMDARVVVGVGNIYASEALHRARVRPTTPVRRLSAPRMRHVHAAVRQVLAAALRAGGTTLQDFRDSDGQAGEFQVRLRVYDRAGLACRRCGRTIRRVVQAGRSTFYCPGCQH